VTRVEVLVTPAGGAQQENVRSFSSSQAVLLAFARRVRARSSGGGSGGTVVVVCERGALNDVDHLIR
jgi:hypothetical protein